MPAGNAPVFLGFRLSAHLQTDQSQHMFKAPGALGVGACHPNPEPIFHRHLSAALGVLRKVEVNWCHMLSLITVIPGPPTFQAH